MNIRLMSDEVQQSIAAARCKAAHYREKEALLNVVLADLHEVAIHEERVLPGSNEDEESI